MWNRFYNKYDRLGGNISLDLKKEQQNKVLKTIWRALGSNLNKASASRVAEALENLERLIESIDKECNLQERQGYRSSGNDTESVMHIISDLSSIKAFKFTPGRPGHPSFPDFQNRIVNLDYRNLHEWMSEKKKLWQCIYSR